MTPTFEELFEQLRFCDESEKIEAKAGIGKAFLETVCAFSNGSGIGTRYVLLGVVPDESTFLPDFRLVGLDNCDELQGSIQSQCASVFSSPIRPRIRVERFKDSRVMVVEVLEAPKAEKPIFFKKEGLPGGAFIRIGSSDVRCTQDDLARFYEDRRGEHYDGIVPENASMSDLGGQQITQYRELFQRHNPDSYLCTVPDREFLISTGCTRDCEREYRPTLAGIILFGTESAYRRIFPVTRVDYFHVNSENWVSMADNSALVSSRQESIFGMIRWTMATIMGDLPKRFKLRPGTLEREEESIIPSEALREAVVNSLLHRDYRVQGSVRVVRYPNRIEITNPGYSLVQEDQLRRSISVARNPTVAARLEDVRFAETRATGIKKILAYLKNAHLHPPAFESNRHDNTFSTVLIFERMDAAASLALKASFPELSEDQKNYLVRVRHLGASDQKDYRMLNDVDSMSAGRAIKDMVDRDILLRRGSIQGVYFTPGPRLSQAIELQVSLPALTQGMTERLTQGVRQGGRVRNILQEAGSHSLWTVKSNPPLATIYRMRTSPSRSG